MRLLLTVSLVAIVLACFAPNAHAVLLAYEGFDYAPAGYNTGLLGKNGGTGFTGGWYQPGTSNVRNGVFSGSLADVTSPYAFAPTGNHGRVQVATTVPGITRTFSSPIGDDSTTVWMSFIYQNNNTSTSEEFAVVFTSNGGTTRNVSIGATGGTGGQSASDGKFDLAREFVSGPTADIANRDQVNHFVVLRFDFGAGNIDTVTAFWSPAMGTNFLGAGNAQISGFDASFTSIGFSATGATVQLDEIRLGTTLQDVAAIPEPATFSLIAIACAAGLLRRHKSVSRKS